jgi:ABC-type hemin transport system substrate-binding protein
MYGRRKPDQTQSSSEKNPNRVAGGLRAQGVDTFEMLGEDGSIQKIPTIEYVRSLEEQSKKQRAAITVLERKLTRQDTAIQQLQSAITGRS